MSLILGSNVRLTMYMLMLAQLFTVDSDNGHTQLLNCQWNSSAIDCWQMLKYQSSEPLSYIFS